MGQADVDAVARHMTLASGYIWSMPIVLDLSQDALDRLGVKPGDALLLTYQEQPLAVLEVSESYAYDKEVPVAPDLRHDRPGASGRGAHGCLPGPFSGLFAHPGQPAQDQSAF